MAASQAAVVREEVGSLLLYTPVVHPREFDVAIAYLVRRLEEGASQENFMSAAFEIAADPALFAREQNRFLESVDSIPTEVPASNRSQNRASPQPPARRHGFSNTADSDPASAANRDWASAIQRRMQASTLGLSTAEQNLISSPRALRQRIDRAVAAGAGWRAIGADARAEILHDCGERLQARRAELLEVMGAESGKVIEQGDPEVSEVVDFAHYYAERGRELERVAGARFTPARLTVVTPPWNFPVAIPGGSVLAGLAAGSPVIIKPASAARRCGAVLVEALWEAGVPRDLLQYVQLEERTLGTELVANPHVERVILTGAYETAELFRSFRPDLPLLGETSGKNAIVVTPSADLDLAARDVAYSAFGHAGQKCSAASLAILVGSAGRSERFRRQLIDAVSSYRVGYPWEPTSQVGPLIGPADGKLLRALTTLEPGQRWVVQPQQLDESGALWKPGIRGGVQPGSEFHLTEYFGPVLGIMTAASLDDAIELVNRIDYGLTSGLQSLDDGEIAHWAERVEAGNLYVNRHITGAIVQRQPFGGWKRASVGNGFKAGGPNYLVAFGSWRDDPDGVRPVEQAAGDRITDATLAVARQAGVTPPGIAWLEAARHRRPGLGPGVPGPRRHRAPCGEQRAALPARPGHHPDPAGHRRAAAPDRRGGQQGAGAGDRQHIQAPARAGAAPPRSAWPPDPRREPRAVGRARVQLAATGGRVRLLGGSSTELAASVSGSPSLAIHAGEVLSAGRIELLTFLREQAISITAHRFGTPRTHRLA